ncbi:MAG: retropepsin-like aspartic protease [Bacteroidota bacterium]|nr:retropepsin-like aspartic protease [Bacteroidota bacterium]
MTEIPLLIVELERDNYHILLEGHFDDDTPSCWIIDTGASKSVLDVNLSSFYEIIDSDNLDDYQSAGINQGMMETSVGKMTYLRFGDMEITGLKVALIDLSHVNEIYSKYTACRIAGLLGGDILMQYQCTIDYERKIIQFHNSWSR